MDILKIRLGSEAYYTLDATIALAEQLSGGSDCRVPYKQIYEMLSLITKNIQQVAIVPPSGHDLKRGRISNNNKITNISELSYKPSKSVNGFGRCNTPHHSVFYGGNNILTVLSELDPEEGDNVYLAVAELNDSPDILKYVSVGEIDNFSKMGHFSADFGGHDLVQKVENIVNPYHENMDQSSARNIYIDAFLATLFRRKVKDWKEYKITSAFSNIVFEKQENTGVLYPTVKSLAGFNCAIPAELFDKFYTINTCIRLRVDKVMGFGMYFYTLLEGSLKIDNDGEITWGVM